MTDSGFIIKDNIAFYKGQTVSFIAEAIIGVTKAVNLLTERIEALEALQTQSCGGNPSDTIEEQTGGSTKATEPIVATPPTFTSNIGIQENE